jgi:heme/copper-type cytochrome/quinol oxidase subunit 2
MGDLWLVFWWTGPIGIGIFLVCVATMVYLLARADAVKRETSAQAHSRHEHLA